MDYIKLHDNHDLCSDISEDFVPKMRNFEVGCDKKGVNGDNPLYLTWTLRDRSRVTMISVFYFYFQKEIHLQICVLSRITQCSFIYRYCSSLYRLCAKRNDRYQISDYLYDLQIIAFLGVSMCKTSMCLQKKTRSILFVVRSR